MLSGVLILAGPTAGGKTDLALRLARRYDAEIVNADSRQIYRDMEIGTAAPTGEQRALVPHHLFAFLDPTERYSAARYTGDAMAAIADIHARGKRAMVVGGTGFYIRALMGGVELAAAHDPQLRARLAHEARLHDSEFLHRWLQLHDATRAAAIAPGDTYRVLRALEVALAGDAASSRTQPLSTLASSGIPVLQVFLDVELPELEERIVRRTDAMLAAGLVEEAERVGADAVAADAVGYPQALAFLRGECTYEELRALLIRATRRYAKRQISWFKNEPLALHLRSHEVDAAAREKLGWV